MIFSAQLLKRAVWGCAVLLLLQATFLWAASPYDNEGDCDVDGADLYHFFSSQGNDSVSELPAFASFFGTFESACGRIGIGSPIDGYPDWHERTLMVFTNMARMAPVAYRNRFMSDFDMPPEGILNDSFPAVAPLYSAHNLNRSARAHALDMALNCRNLQHDSCDGTPWDERIHSFYPAAGAIGENVAYTSYTDPSRPWYIVNLFLCDAVDGVCATDDQPFYIIGHRANIMSASFTELGCGSAEGGSAYWVQDFNGVELPPQPPVAAGSHAMLEAGRTSFLLNYYDEAGLAPPEVTVVVDDQHHAMALGLGEDSAGTYQVEVPRSDGCRAYYFLVTDAGGNRYRYPGDGLFHTFGEGGCLVDYTGMGE